MKRIGALLTALLTTALLTTALLITALLTTALLITACGTTDSSSSGTQITAEDQKLLSLVNEARKSGCRCGDSLYGPAGSVVWDAKLAEISRRHSEDMISRNFFAHNTPDGKTPWDRLKAGGYVYSSAAENIAAGYSSPEDVIAGWLSSPGHCANIMNPRYTHMGVGRSQNHWTQMFSIPAK